MQKVLEKLEIINHILMQDTLPIKDIGLLNGKMGISIYFFHLAQTSGNTKYQEFAEMLIGELYEETGKGQILMDFENGLAGIGYGITYLVKKGFVEADLDDILSDADDKIYKYIITQKERLSIDIKQGTMGYILYLLNRLQEKNIKDENSASIFILRRMLIDLINHTAKLIEEGKYRSHSPLLFDISWDLPICLVLLANIRAMNFYNVKIDRILENLSPVILSSYPYLPSNRLYLLLGMESILNEVDLPLWKKHANLLKKDLRLSDIIHNEFKNKNIHFMDGLAGINLISKLLYSTIEDKQLLFQKNDLIEKIMKSEYWNDINGNKQKRKDLTGLLFGLSGLGMFLLELSHEQKRIHLNLTDLFYFNH